MKTTNKNERAELIEKYCIFDEKKGGYVFKKNVHEKVKKKYDRFFLGGDIVLCEE